MRGGADGSHRAFGGAVSYPAKIERALQVLEASGISRSKSAPLFHRALWEFGIPIRPPLFSSFWRHSVFMTTVFVACMGPMFLSGWERIRGDFRIAFVAGLPIFGGLMFSAINEWARRRQKLPDWAEVDLADRFD
jgi:hypothetical protein